MPPTPLPPASIWEHYPEVAIIVLVSLVFTGLFIWYNERREKMWMTFLREQRKASDSALGVVLEKLVSRIEDLGQKMDSHDDRMNNAITKMDERTRPRRKGEG